MSHAMKMQEERNLLSIQDVGPSPLVNVLEFLSVQDICYAAQTCRVFREASRVDRVWKKKAEEVFPLSSLTVCDAGSSVSSFGNRDAMSPKSGNSCTKDGCETENDATNCHSDRCYSSFRELVEDDNAMNTSLYLPLRDASSDCRFNCVDSYYDAVITGVELHRATDKIRVYFDARGEIDLKRPMASSLGLCVHNPQISRLRLRREMEFFRRRCLELQTTNGSPDVIESLMNGRRSYFGFCSSRDVEYEIQKAVHSYTMMQNQIYTHLIDTPNIKYCDLVMPMRPLREELAIDTPGHYKGFLEFQGLEEMHKYLQKLHIRQDLQKRVLQRGLDLVFCYGSPLVVMPEVS